MKIDERIKELAKSKLLAEKFRDMSVDALMVGNHKDSAFYASAASWHYSNIGAIKAVLEAEAAA